MINRPINYQQKVIINVLSQCMSRDTTQLS